MEREALGLNENGFASSSLAMSGIPGPADPGFQNPDEW